MTVRLYPPIAHEHDDLRQELAKLTKILSHASCPPAGHAFYSFLQASGDYFERELPDHVQEEEAELYPRLRDLVPPSALARLREQHAALLVLTAMYTRQFQAFKNRPDERGWMELRHIGRRLIDAVSDHLNVEEAVLADADPKDPQP